MSTLPLFNELEDPKAVAEAAAQAWYIEWKAAIRADVEAIGGNKEAGKHLFPKQSPTTAQGMVSNAGNPKQDQELNYRQIQKLKALARKAIGFSHIHLFESKYLKAEVRWVTVQEEAQQVAVDLGAMMKGVHDTLGRAVDVLQRLREGSK